MIKFIKNYFLKIKAKRSRNETSSMWSEPYNSWKEAEDNSIGYHAENIFLKVKESTLAVKNEEYPYERDSVVFDHIEYSWPLLSILQKIAIENNNTLTIIDFGGSLGSSYFQNKQWLTNIKIKWIVIEQEQFVISGKKDFEDGSLIFENTLKEALKYKPSAILFSSVLQYLENPNQIIKEAIENKLNYILIDRTSFAKNIKTDIYTVQTVPKEIYKAVYPCRFFKETDFITQFVSDYNIITDFPSYCDPNVISNGITYYWKGFIFKIK